MKRLLFIAGAAAVFACCGGDGNRSPVVPTVINPVAPTPAGDAVASLQVTGNTHLTSVGETSQLTATAGFVSGASRDVTSETIWHSFNPEVATISARGLLTAVTLGRALINASFQTRASNNTLLTKAINREVVVLPAGTFIVRGRVNEPGNLDIWNARFEVVDGPQAGRFTMTDSFGGYELYGLSGDIRVTVTKEGYIAQTKSVAITQDRVLNFEILPAVAPTAIAGNYRLTFTASQRCASKLVEEARTRIYSARINQDQARVDGLLSGANFALEPSTGIGNGFQGRIEANSVTFSFADWYFDGVVEQLGPATYLSIWGTATAMLHSRRFLVASMAVWNCGKLLTGSTQWDGGKSPHVQQAIISSRSPSNECSLPGMDSSPQWVLQPLGPVITRVGSPWPWQDSSRTASNCRRHRTAY